MTFLMKNERVLNALFRDAESFVRENREKYAERGNDHGWRTHVIICINKQERKNIMEWKVSFDWKNMPLSHKIATVIAGLAVVVWLLAEVRPGLLPFDPTYPAIAVFTVCEAVTYWKTKRTWALLLIGGAVISIACCMLELML